MTNAQGLTIISLHLEIGIPAFPSGKPTKGLHSANCAESFAIVQSEIIWRTGIAIVLPLFEIVRVLVGLDRVASFILNASDNHSFLSVL